MNLEWIRSRHTFAYAGLAALAVVLFVLWLHGIERAAADAAIAQERLKADKVVVAAYRDSLVQSKAAVDTARASVKTAIEVYTAARAQLKPRLVVDTLKIPSDLPGSPKIRLDSGFVLPLAYVRSADSLKTTCTALDISCARERVHADSVLTAQARELEESAKLLSSQRRRGLLARLEDWGIGAGVGLSICGLRR